jgi:hypothetical protein
MCRCFFLKKKTKGSERADPQKLHLCSKGKKKVSGARRTQQKAKRKQNKKTNEQQ